MLERTNFKRSSNQKSSPNKTKLTKIITKQKGALITDQINPKVQIFKNTILNKLKNVRETAFQKSFAFLNKTKNAPKKKERNR
ncbi:hypothetical protein EUTSA_v10010924mg [Eutrema salsugineum]|uniref:Uncharacterized protein n=1 Tax=Eutrema salsugineum TaxID=72664 RepID=V4NFF6_EUTSA|nr:hypothetical protein EUTSA_v10011028mg [Eutrema salsugineum]ESQ44862.1 hypothetical protein EUTSA_v10010924mg [Eutrema salsugineum]